MACWTGLLLLCWLRPRRVAAHGRSPDAALAQLLREARANLRRSPTDRLSRILCGERIRIGVRDYYPLFATREGEVRSGLRARCRARHRQAARRRARLRPRQCRHPHPDARPRIASTSSSRPWATTPSATARCASSGRTITSRRRRWSGPRRSPSKAGTTSPAAPICVTVGNGSNAELVSHNARLMLFDEAGVLPERLKRRDLHAGRAGRQLLRLLFHRPRFAADVRAEVRLRPGAVGHGAWRAPAATSSPARST